MNAFPTSLLRSGLAAAALGSLMLATSSATPGGGGQVPLPSSSSVQQLGTRRCRPALPLPPADPSIDQDWSCYYWGYYLWNDGSGSGNVEGRVYWPDSCDGDTAPDSELQLPLVLLMHGDGHQFTDYHYLVRHLAFNGFIVATINNSGSNAERAAQAKTFLDFLRDHWQYKDWVDEDNVGLIGHSRGGEAALTVARLNADLNWGYDVNAIVSLAPTDNQEGGGVHESIEGSHSEAFLGIYGTHDEDVTGYCMSGGLPGCGAPLVSARGSAFSLYDRAGGEGSTEPFPLYDAVVDKALVYIEGANHNGWRETCGGFPPPGVLSCNTHKELAKGYTNAFLRWHLRNQDVYERYFNGDFRLPIANIEDIDVHKSYSKGYDRRVVDNFEQPGFLTNTIGGLNVKEVSVTIEKDGSTWDYDPTSPHDTRSATISWGAGGFLPFIRMGIPDNGTFNGGRYRDVTRYDYLSLRAGQLHGSVHNTPGQDKDFYVRLRDSSGGVSPLVQVSDYARLVYPDLVQVIKFNQPLLVTSSPMKTVRIPMCRFGGVDLQNVSSVEFLFSVTGSASGELFLDNVEFTD